MERWRAQLAAGDITAGSHTAGIVQVAIVQCITLIYLAVREFMQDPDLGEKATVGSYVNLLEEHARHRWLSCTELDRKFLTRPEVQVLKDFSRDRAALAHQEGRLIEGIYGGRLTVDHCLQMLDRVEAVATLPMMDELVCREAGQQGEAQPATNGPAATLVINADSAYCAACGGHADYDEATHEHLLGPNGLDDPDGGCGARFIEVATDEATTPQMVEAIRECRPDLPFIGKHGFEGHA